MSTETVETAPAPEPTQTEREPTQTGHEAEAKEADKPEADKPAEEQKAEEKKQKEWWEKELQKKQRRIDALTRRLYQRQDLPAEQINGTNRPQQDDSETLSLSRAEFERLAAERAQQLAPQIAEHSAAIERRTGVYRSLESELGAEKFADLSRDLEDALDGLKAPNGQPKAIVDAIFDAESPRAVLEYLADPDNADEAADLSRMPPLQLGRAMAKLESKLAAKKAEAKPQPSKATPPIEPIKGAGGVRDDSPRDDDSIEEWMRKERKRVANRFG